MPEFTTETEGIRVPPQAIDVEQAVLAAMMLDKEAISDAIESIDETYFYKDSHRKIFKAIIDLYDRHEAVDMLTITEDLKKKRKSRRSWRPSPCVPPLPIRFDCSAPTSWP